MNASRNSAQNTPPLAYCPHCGKQLQPGARFCNYCGENLPGAAPAPKKKPSVSKAKRKPGSGRKALLILMIFLALVMLSAIVLALLPHGKKDFAKLYPEYQKESWCLLSDDGSKIGLVIYPEDTEDPAAAHNAACQALEKINTELGFDEDFLSMESYGDENQRTVENDQYIATWCYDPVYGLVYSYEFK